MTYAIVFGGVFTSGSDNRDNGIDSLLPRVYIHRQ